MFEIWIFFLQKRMDSQQEAFIYPPEPCEAHFFMDSRTLFNMFWTVQQKHPLTAMITLRMQAAESLAMFKKHLKTHLFRHHLTN